MHDRVAWSRHPRFRIAPASMLLSIHDSFRAAMDRLDHLEGSARVWLFRRLAMSLDHHHHAEEALLFPEVQRVTGVAPERLEADHEALTTALAEAEAALSRDPGADLSALRTVLLDHLQREEATVIPVMLEHEDFRGP